MNRRHYLEYGVAVIPLLIAGCGYVPEGDTVSVTLHGERGETPSDVALNPITVSESMFQLHGRLAAEHGKLNEDLYRDVSIQLYSEDGQPLCSHQLGDWEGDVQEVSFSTEMIPTYVVLYSPDFWDEPMAVDYFVHEKDRDLFVPEEATSKDELPVAEIPAEIPSCDE